MTEVKNKSLNDYKFYCVNGEPLFVQVMTDREPNTHTMRVALMDMNWHPHPEYCSTLHKQPDEVIKPKSFVKMIEMAKNLSSPFEFVRVDFYEVSEKPVFGEMTFTPGFDTVNFDFERIIGERIIL